MNRARNDANRVEQDFTDSRSMTFPLSRIRPSSAYWSNSKRPAGPVRWLSRTQSQSPSWPCRRPPLHCRDGPIQPRVGALLVTALVSGLSGAGLSWWVLTGQATQSAQHMVLATAQPGNAGVSTAAVLPIISPATAGSNALPVPPGGAVAGTAQVLDFVEGWRQAWERRDVDA
jgi:hypothetical protein